MADGAETGAIDDAETHATDGAAAERARRGVRAWVRATGRRARGGVRAATPYGILAFLTASAVAPVAGAGLGATGEFAAALGQLGGMGSNYLADVLAGTATRLREQPGDARTGDAPTEEQWRDAVAEALQPLLATDDERGRALRADVGRLLRSVDAVGTALAASMTADGMLHRELTETFESLGTDIGELHWMLAETRRGIDDLRHRLAEESARQRRQLTAIRQDLVTIAVLSARDSRGAAPTTEPRPARVPPDGDDVCPYPGLASFQPTDAAWYRGREPQVALLLSRLIEQLVGGPPLIVTGVSGVGKSSLLRAGLLPAIGAGGLGADAASWPWVLLTPGDDPLDDLIGQLTALAPGHDLTAVAATVRDRPDRLGDLIRRLDEAGARPVIVVDQFEELFTRCADPDRRLAFVTALTNAAPALVVLAVRADFYASCAELPPLARVLAAGHVVLGPLTDGELRRVIREPAELAGLTIEPGLVEVLLRDLGADAPGGYQPGTLPLLGHALRATWERRTDGRLTVAGYRDTGGIGRAIAESAERIFLDLDADGRAALRTALLNLVTIADNGAVVRRPRARAGIDAAVLTRLVADRLVTVGDDRVEISHEALLANWPRLTGWLVEAREEILLRQRITDAARDWTAAGEDPDLLLRGARLAAARERAAVRAELTDTERRYVEASAVAAELAEAARRRGVRRLRRLAVGLGVALLLAVTGGLAAVDRQNTADEQRRQATSRQYAAEAVAALPNDELLAMRRAVDGWDQAPTVEARGALLSAQMTNTVGTLGSDNGGNSVAVSPDGRLAAIGHPDGRVRLWDIATLRQRGADLVHAEVSAGTQVGASAVSWLAFSPNGQFLATGSVMRDGLRIWDVATGAPVRTLPGTAAMAWLPDTNIVVASRSDAAQPLRLGGWDVTTGRQMLDIPTGDKLGFDLAVSRDGAYLAMADSRRETTVWRVADRREVSTVPHSWRLAFAADNSLVTRSRDGRLAVWAMPSGKAVRTLAEPGGAPTQPVVSPDGMVFSSGESAAFVSGWPLSGTGESYAFGGITGTLASLGLSADGRTLVVTGTDRPSIVYRRLTDWLSQSTPVSYLAADPAGPHLAAAVQNGSVRVWDRNRRTWVRDLRPDEPTGVAYAPDGILAVSTGRGSVDLYGADGGRLAPLPDAGPPGTAVDTPVFSPDGSLLAAAVALPDPEDPEKRRHRVAVWRIPAGGAPTLLELPARVPDFPSGEADALAFTSTGDTLVAAVNGANNETLTVDRRATIYTWRTTGLTPAGQYDLGPYLATDMAVSPDGRLVAVAGTNRLVELRELPSGRLVRELSHPTAVRQVSFAPDGRTVATATVSDYAVRLWDTGSGLLTAHLTGHRDEINAIVFAPDGLLFTGSYDTSVGVWQLDPDEAVRRLCRLLVPAIETRDDPTDHPPAACRR
ncbi:NACHT and WD repeat domain-containing protein [Plantactinospora sp. GCM10030261]|uniref:NACHT and WD repeat domain-containing protein n=1 Tax=Plantactinospora sp. GCM10030261 TaxID=3273420 RepID=UPI00361B0B7B